MKGFMFRILVLGALLLTIPAAADDETDSQVSYPALSLEGFEGSNGSFSSGRSLLSVSTPGKQDASLIATLDGTINLVDEYSKKVLWSFYSGPSIYSSYQAPIYLDEHKEMNASGLSYRFFFECGDDWQLYMHNRHLGLKVKLTIPMEDIIKSTPQILEDGGVMLGSKKTTAFLVDARTGRLINSYKSSDDEGRGFSDVDMFEKMEPGCAKPLPLYITRIDYSLQTFAPDSGKLLWNMTVAEIGAALFCQDALSSSSSTVASLVSPYGVGSENLNMPLSCHSMAVVHRHHVHNMPEFFSKYEKLLRPLPNDIAPLDPASNPVIPMLPKSDGLLDFPQEGRRAPLSSSELMWVPQPKYNQASSEKILGHPLSPHKYNYMLTKPIPVLVSLCSIAICLYALVTRKPSVLKHGSTDLGEKNVPSKKKRSRKIGKHSSIDSKDKSKIAEKETDSETMESDNKVWWNHEKNFHVDVSGRRIGKLFVFNTEIAKGSNGTVVLQGNYDGRSVAVKRLVQAHHDVAFKEIQNLVASDHHPNIVRWFGVEYDQDFVYLSLERCTCSLNDLILAHSASSQDLLFTEVQGARTTIDHKLQLEILQSVPDISLWKASGHPSPLLLKLMRDVVSGLVHLHELGIVHRDLKPQNVLVSNERSLCAKLSDMGISKRLPEDMSSLSHHATGNGSSGWQAPEQLLHGRQTRAVDMFSLGCVLFFCMTGGKHPYGDRLERDINIVKNQVDLFLVEYFPEAMDLFSLLLDPDPNLRPKAVEVLSHPLFWDSEMRLSFLRDTSDRIELEDRETSSVLLKTLESIAPVTVGTKWDEKMDVGFMNNIGRYRRYRFDSVRDLLRVMRNKLNHYRELPRDVREILGSVPDGFDGYFARRFPKLLIEVYKVVYRCCKEEECFQKYFRRNYI